LFDLDTFLADCQAAVADPDQVGAVREVLARTLERPGDLADALPADKATFNPLYSSPELTVLHVVWGPAMKLPPHDHLMWALIGVYGGAEDNAYFRRRDDSIEAAGGRRVATGEVLRLGHDVIHAVTNPNRDVSTGAIHVYGGDFMHKARHRWDPESMEEHRTTGEDMRRIFEANSAALDS